MGGSNEIVMDSMKRELKASPEREMGLIIMVLMVRLIINLKVEIKSSADVRKFDLKVVKSSNFLEINARISSYYWKNNFRRQLSFLLSSLFPESSAYFMMSKLITRQTRIFLMSSTFYDFTFLLLIIVSITDCQFKILKQKIIIFK